MKKGFRKKLLFTIAFIMLIVPLLTACTEKVKLETPTGVEFQLYDDTQRRMLVTQKNIYASGYIFGISSTEYNGIDYKNFVKFHTQNNYLDVTNILNNAQTYYFYAQVVGSGQYITSDPSVVKKQEITYILQSTTLSINNKMLSWHKVDNAYKYEIYYYASNKANAKSILSGDQKGGITETTYDLTSFIDAHNNEGALHFYVQCCTNNNYLSSGDSNEVEYNSHLPLAAPTGLNISSSHILSWNEVSNCDNYIIKVNNNDNSLIYVESKDLKISSGVISYDASASFTSLGEYSFAVKANKTGNYIASDYCDAVQITYTQKLNTPRNTRCICAADNVEITWDEVDYASIYSLFIDNKQFYVNGITGTSSNIMTNSITLTFSELGITTSDQLSGKSITIRADGYGYYTSSNKSDPNDILIIGADQILEAPVVTDDEDNKAIEWSRIKNAQGYIVSISFNGKIQEIDTGIAQKDTYCEFAYSSYLVSAGDYSLRVKAVAQDERFNSEYSSPIDKSIEKKLNTPIINDVSLKDEYYYIDFEEDEYANLNSLYINNVLITDCLSMDNARISAQDVKEKISPLVNYNFVVQSLDNGKFYKESNKSQAYEFSTNLSQPTNVKIVNERYLSWNAVPNARTYELFLDDIPYTINADENTYDLQSVVATNETRQIRIKAQSEFLNDSSLSNVIYYNNVLTKIIGYTDKYFYSGKTYDYYLSSEDEFYIAIEYMVDNFITQANYYINYSTPDNETISTRFKNVCNRLTGTYSFTPSCTNSSLTEGKTKITLSFSEISSAPTYQPSTTQSTTGAKYSIASTRRTDYSFLSDSYIVSQDVYSTDGLLSAIQNKAKPNFMTANSIAEQVYNKAKEILISICDDNMTDYQKALAIHDYLVTKISYDTYGLGNVTSGYVGYYHYMESAFFYNLGVCDAYSKCFSLLCNMEGIQTIVISGLADRSDSSSGHAWNKIYLDANNDGTKNWFIVDCTDDDPVISKTTKEQLLHEYFMIPDSYVSQRSEDADYPEAGVSSERYYDLIKVNNTSLVVDTLINLQSINNYVSSTGNTVEFLLKATLSSFLNNSSTAYAYSMNRDYNLVIMHA